MTDVDIYLTQAKTTEEHASFAARLLEKAYTRRMSAYVITPDASLAHALDEALWTYREDSFIPHQLAHEGPDSKTPIVIAIGTPEAKTMTPLLVNLTSQETLPGWFSNYRRIADIVIDEPESIQKARLRYRQYQQSHCQLKMHDLRKVATT